MAHCRNEQLPRPKLLMQIILLGDSAAGKSKLLTRFLEDQYNPRTR
jgi:GTPase SAR1 family protein